MAKNDILILKNTLSYFRFVNVWPDVKEQFNPSRRFYIKFILRYLSCSFLFIGTFLHLIVVIRDNIDVDISIDITYLISFMGGMLALCNHVYNVKGLALLYREMSNFENHGKPYNFDKENSYLNLQSNIFNCYNLLCVFSLALSPPFYEKNICEELNRKKNLSEICGLEQPLWLPFNVDRSPIKEVLLIIQIYSIFYTAATGAYICYGFFEAAQHIQIRIRHLKSLFHEAINKNDYYLFKKSIKYHVDVLRYIQVFDDCYKIGNMIHVVLTAAIVGCLGYQLLKTISFATLALGIGWFVSCVFAAAAGQNITDECSSVTNTLIESNWYDCDMALKKDLIFVIMRSQKPVYLRAQPFTYLSFQFLINIVKSSYSYLTLLSTTANK